MHHIFLHGICLGRIESIQLISGQVFSTFYIFIHTHTHTVTSLGSLINSFYVHIHIVRLPYIIYFVLTTENIVNDN